jgi:hypothetical protein
MELTDSSLTLLQHFLASRGMAIGPRGGSVVVSPASPPGADWVPAIRPAVVARQTGPDRTSRRRDGDCSIGIRWVSVPVRLQPLGTSVSGHVLCRRHPPIDHRGIPSRPGISQVI